MCIVFDKENLKQAHELVMWLDMLAIEMIPNSG